MELNINSPLIYLYDKISQKITVYSSESHNFRETQLRSEHFDSEFSSICTGCRRLVVKFLVVFQIWFGMFVYARTVKLETCFLLTVVNFTENYIQKLSLQTTSAARNSGA